MTGTNEDWLRNLGVGKIDYRRGRPRKAAAYVCGPTLHSVAQQEAVCVEYARTHDLALNVDRAVFRDLVGEPRLQREELREVLSWYDVIVVAQIGRLADDVAELATFLDSVTTSRVRLVSALEPIDTSTSVGAAMVTVLCAVRQFFSIDVELDLERAASSLMPRDTLSP